MPVTLDDFYIRICLQQSVVERCAHLANATAVLRCQGIAAEDAVSQMPAVLLGAVANRVVEAPGFTRQNNLVIDPIRGFLNVECAVGNHFPLRFCVLRRTFKGIGG